MNIGHEHVVGVNIGQENVGGGVNIGQEHVVEVNIGQEL